MVAIYSLSKTDLLASHYASIEVSAAALVIIVAS
jgi:hypothetical protein